MSRYSSPSPRAGLLAAVLLGAAALPAQAAYVTNDFGLSLPHQTLDFESEDLVMNQSVSTEFQAFGVSFGNAYGNPDPSGGYPNISGNRIGNFQGGIGNQGTLVMDFANVLSGVAFAMVTAPGTSTLQAYLNNVLVDSMVVATDATSSANYHGFDGLQFNRVTLSVVSFNQALMVDNLQTIAAAAPVPEPAGWALVLLALCGLAAFGRPPARRKPR